MAGPGLVMATLVFCLWAGEWVDKAIAAYDRRTAALRADVGSAYPKG